jgi:hypothetical protein
MTGEPEDKIPLIPSSFIGKNINQPASQRKEEKWCLFHIVVATIIIRRSDAQIKSRQALLFWLQKKARENKE